MYLSAFAILSRCIFIGFRTDMKPMKAFTVIALILIRSTIEFLNVRDSSMYVPPSNRLKIEMFSIYRFNYPTQSFKNPIIIPAENVLKRFIKHIFIRINHCFISRIEIFRSRFYVSIFFCVFA